MCCPVRMTEPMSSRRCLTMPMSGSSVRLQLGRLNFDPGLVAPEQKNSRRVANVQLVSGGSRRRLVAGHAPLAAPPRLASLSPDAVTPSMQKRP